MHQSERLVSTIRLLVVVTAAAAATAGEDRVVFMESAGFALPGITPTYRQVTDRDQLEMYRGWTENEHAQRALDLYARAWATMRARGRADEKAPPLYIALVANGNHAETGFQLRTDKGTAEYPRTPYIKLDPNEQSFGITMLHESGHVVLSVLNNGEGIPTRNLASIPHSTAALTDRGTAFDEGFAIHLETLAVHLSDAPDVRKRYRHERMAFGFPQPNLSEYSRQAADLATYSQNLARYQEVRDNSFAFVGAYRGPDYLRTQLEKARDFAALRDANQLLQSEGFYASFFFAYLMRGDAIPAPAVLAERQNQMLATLAASFADREITPDAPHLLYFVEENTRLFPDEAREVLDVLLDLSHGVFVDPDAKKLWREHYLAALRLDINSFRSDGVERARVRWREAAQEDPAVLYSRLGPQIPCAVPEVQVSLVAFGGAIPLLFDINTVQEGIIRMVPGISDTDVTRWLDERERAPFANAGDFKQRAAPSAECAAGMRF